MKGKKLISYLLVGASVLSLTACGGQAADAEIKQNDTPAASGTEATAEAGSSEGEAAGVALGFEPYEEELNIHIGRLASQHTVSTLLPGDTLEDNPYTR